MKENKIVLTTILSTALLSPINAQAGVMNYEIRDSRKDSTNNCLIWFVDKETGKSYKGLCRKAKNKAKKQSPIIKDNIDQLLGINTKN